ncbi:MAG: penicillin-binding protein 2 [Lentisphaeria bacterium]|jgi:penicillin-binding protein 2
MSPDRAPTHPFLIPRLWQIAGACTAALLLLVGRMWSLQMRRHDLLDQDIRRQSIRRIRLEPVRGRIFSADGKALVDNRPTYNLVLHLAEMRQPGPHRRTSDFILQQVAAVAGAIRRPSALTQDELLRHDRTTPALPLTIFQDLTPAEMARATDLQPPIPGLEIQPRILRTYRHSGLAGHLLGFTGRRHPEEWDASADTLRLAYSLPELTGRDGLERFYDNDLAGRPGERLVQVDIRGYIHADAVPPTPPQDGADLCLSLDSRAQRAAELAIAGYRGALVLVEVQTGAIKAMVSAPGIDLSTLTAARYRELAADTENQPLLNRAVAGQYIPGSILKPLTALAALEADKITASSTVTCTGAYPLGNRAIRCWYHPGHGPLNLAGALQHSCNSFFIDAGIRLTPAEFLTLLRDAGLGEAPEIDLPGAARGILPDPAAAARLPRTAWISEAALLAIGQGAIAITPLQAALYTAAIANGGTVFRPYLVERLRNPDGSSRRITAPIALRRLPVRQKHLALVRQGMWQAVNLPDGTARQARTAVISMAGKTGTAQFQTRAGMAKNTWFIGYAPADQPRYAFAVVTEHGQSGGQTAPIVRRTFELWLTPGALEAAEAQAAGRPPPPPPDLPPEETLPAATPEDEPAAG